ncbi:MAG: AAA family ATPase [Acidobacteriota bacterium]
MPSAVCWTVGRLIWGWSERSNISSVRFASFRLDSTAGRLFELATEERPVALTPKAYDLLALFLRHPGELLTKNHLLDTVWEGRSVTEGVLKVTIRELRKVLGDDARHPTYIETAHRKGYRFIAPVERGPSPLRLSAEVPGRRELIGREHELAVLDQAFQECLTAQRRTCFLSGGAGIGKTRLVESFLEGLGDPWVIRGHCLEHYGAGEPYLPLLEALGRLCRSPRGTSLVPLLRRFAPTWLLQMSSLVQESEWQALHRETVGATPERMLREMAEALEALSQESPVVLVLEDLHWSDRSTLDLVSLLARRPDRARLLTVATFRPSDPGDDDPPLEQLSSDLEARRQGQLLELQELDSGQVAALLDKRFSPHRFPRDTPRRLLRHTGGNPLFLTLLLDDLVAEGRIHRDGESWVLDQEARGIAVPDEIRQLIMRRFEGSGDRTILETAAVAGAEFSAAAVAAGLDHTALGVEETCERWVQRGVLVPAGIEESGQGALTARYGFAHALYQQVLYEALPSARRSRLHHHLGRFLEQTHGERADAVASELANHFERALDRPRAIRYLRRAAATAARRTANREAVDHLGQALALLGEDESALRLELLKERGLIHRARGDMPSAVADFESLAALAARSGAHEQEIEGLLYLVSALYWFRRERCLTLIDDIEQRAAVLDDPLLQTHVRGYCGHWNLNLRGWRAQDEAAFLAAVEAAESSGDRGLVRQHTVRHVYLSCLKGDYSAADHQGAAGMSLALDEADAFDYFVCLFFRVWARLHNGRWDGLGPMIRDGITMAEKNGHETWALLLRIALGWRHQQARDLETARRLCEPALSRAREAYGDTGQLLFKSLIVAAWVDLAGGDPSAALAKLAEVQRRRSGDAGLMDWILLLPLSLGKARAELAQGSPEVAQRAAEELHSLAVGPGESSYRAHAATLVIEAALAQGRHEGLEEWARELAGDLAPPVAWAGGRTLERLRRLQGRPEEAAAAQRQAAHAVAVLDQRLSDDLELRATFRADREVAELLANGVTSSQGR